MGFRRVVWETIAGFDNAWQRGATEIEFAVRAQLAGFTVGWVPEAVVAYRHSDSIASETRRRYRSAQAMPRLYAQFRCHGMPGTRMTPALRAWAWLAFRAPWAAFNAVWRTKWLQVAAWRGGLLAGSIRYRVIYL
jgi:GT2 family glycosyltransferase